MPPTPSIRGHPQGDLASCMVVTLSEVSVACWFHTTPSRDKEDNQDLTHACLVTPIPTVSPPNAAPIRMGLSLEL